VRESEPLHLPGGVTATLLTTVDRANRRLWYTHVDTSRSHADYLHAHGSPIRYAYVEQPFPLASYQTVFARVPGSAEMPSAARPFSARTLDALAARDVGLQTVTLHCGRKFSVGPPHFRFSIRQKAAHRFERLPTS
jgi:S-adenosylmethionine:tRNA ribosyltransferase-isomerase